MTEDGLMWETPQTPDPADLAVVDGGLGAYNEEAADIKSIRKLACFARSPKGEVVAGAVGRCWGTAAELQQLWVRSERRKMGIGARLVRLFEEDARRRGCALLFLETFSFQGPEFYRKLGYEVACELNGFPAGASKFIMRKELDRPRETHITGVVTR